MTRPFSKFCTMSFAKLICIEADLIHSMSFSLFNYHAAVFLCFPELLLVAADTDLISRKTLELVSQELTHFTHFSWARLCISLQLLHSTQGQGKTLLHI